MNVKCGPRWATRASAAFVIVCALSLPSAVAAQTTVNVSTEAQLQNAVANLTSNTTIVIAPGTYRLSRTLWVQGPLSNVVIRGGTSNAADVVLQGPGMAESNYGNVPHGIWTGDGVSGVTIANLTIRDIYKHGLIFNPGTQSPKVSNLRLIDIGSQFLKANPTNSTSGVDNGIVEHSVFQYTTEAPDTYFNAIDVHTGKNWIIRGNLFRNFVVSNALADPAVLMWNGSANTLTEGNVFINCERGIAYGLRDRSGSYDHYGGIIRNNFISRTSSQSGDIGISVADSPHTKVLNNTVILSGTFAYPIESRFPEATNVLIANNLIDGSIRRRDGSTGTTSHNVTNATASMFVNVGAGDLHLVSTATAAIDRGATFAEVPVDLDGDARPQGAAVDVGADEFRSSTTTVEMSVQLTSPADGSQYTAPATIQLAADATATPTGITKVEFFAGTTRIAEDTSAPYSATVSGVPAGTYELTAVARHTSGASATSNAATITVAEASAPSPTPLTIFGSAKPSTFATADKKSVELGMKFRADVDGYVVGVRYYKSPYDNGVHTGSLWTLGGTRLASGRFTDETSSGWQEVTFTTPVAIKANTTYIVSYYTSAGQYAYTTNFFASSGVITPPLRALSTSEANGNGVYRYGTGGFPKSTYKATNYWVDVLFVPK